ncbi:hypothetical protein [Jannaschia faecimaris]|uniref:hypothetical protein n=1 Tax=Jannaschia faecimaris TaxID=1244108 RepID=UPI001113E0B2|nr:hypothetical protein [Jannaschia faecimaris]
MTPDPAGSSPVAQAGRTAPPGPSGDRLWDSSAFLMGWMARLPRWLVWSLSVICGLSTAIWTARQPDVLNGIIVLAGFAGLFLPVLAYGALRYALGLSIRLTIGALQLAVLLFIGYVALVAMGVVEP